MTRHRSHFSSLFLLHSEVSFHQHIVLALNVVKKIMVLFLRQDIIMLHKQALSC